MQPLANKPLGLVRVAMEDVIVVLVALVPVLLLQLVARQYSRSRRPIPTPFATTVKSNGISIEIVPISSRKWGSIFRSKLLNGRHQVLAGAVNNVPCVLTLALPKDFKEDHIGPNDLTLDTGADYHVIGNIDLIVELKH